MMTLERTQDRPRRNPPSYPRRTSGFSSTAFPELFDELPRLSRALAAAGLTLLMATIGLLVAPSMQHRIAEQGQDSPRVLAIATISVVWALLPLSIALAFDVFIAMDRIAGTAWGAGSGAGFFVMMPIT